MSKWRAGLCSEVQPKPFKWLWPGYLPRAKVIVLDGDPGVGKSLVMMDLIARLSRGAPFPDGTPGGPPVTCMLLSAEDDAADTIRPRAEAAGADLTKLVLLEDHGWVPQLPDELEDLEYLIASKQARLVVLDPFMAMLSAGAAANVDQCMRQVLRVLTRSAWFWDSTIVLIRHLTKLWRERALMRGQGSAGIIGAVRTGLFAGPAPAGAAGADRVLAVSKTNVAARPPALGYRVVASPAGPPVIEWTGPVDVTADALVPRRGLRPRERAVDWLRRELAAGPRRAADLYAAAGAAGIPDRTLNRAKKELPAGSHQGPGPAGKRGGEWWWYDPSAAWPAAAPFERPAE